MSDKSKSEKNRKNEVEVSVVLPTYNGSKFLDEAISSVFKQTYSDYELVVVDDGSTDPNVKAICNRYKNKLTYIFQENRGLPAARNTGIVNSRGTYICFIDDDDIWMPEKLELQINFYKGLPSSKKVGLVFTWSVIIDETGKAIGYKKIHVEGNIFYDLFHQCLVYAPSSVMIRRDVFEIVGLFDEFFRMRQDWEIYFRIAKVFNIYSLDSLLVKYRMHSSKLSNRANMEKLEFYELKVLEKVFHNEKDNVKVCQMQNDVMAKQYLRYAAGYFLDHDIKNCHARYRRALKYEKKSVGILFRLMYITSFSPRFIRNILIWLFKAWKHGMSGYPS